MGIRCAVAALEGRTNGTLTWLAPAEGRSVTCASCCCKATVARPTALGLPPDANAWRGARCRWNRRACCNGN
eukprot:1936349-Pyramimonas_sp.AAC.1